MQISVIIPTYNRYHFFLQRALKSVYAQTFPPYEVIVVDDGSTDNTQEIQNDFPNIRYIYQQNSGVSSARNLGLQHARGEWIAFLDSDDVWIETKLQRQKEFHQAHPHILMSYTDEVWIRNNQEVTIPKKFCKIGKDAFLENLEYCNIAPSSVIMHRKIFEDVGVFDSALEVCEDYDLWLRVALKYTIALVDAKLIQKYAGHPQQLSFKHWGMDRFRVQSLEKLLPFSGEKKGVVIQTLLKKYKLLQKGAKKYDKIPDIHHYEQKIKKIKDDFESDFARK
jgi:glycosyltransferase involved in cell wall biosynthesis